MVQQTSDLKVLKISKAPETNEQADFLPSKQSANVLFKFMDRLEYLKQILVNKAIMPRYYEEKVDYLKIDGIDKIAFPMTCFCDIHLNRLIYHMKNYGYYGIGLEKNWGIRQGIQPIHYINQYSHLRKDFSEILNIMFKMRDEDRIKYNSYHNHLLHSLFYMKPIEGQMITKGIYEKRNFHDEKEWRFIPNLENVDTELPLVIDLEQMNPKSYQAYSQGISQRSELWLHFELRAIKYIIVKDQEERKELIDFIINEKLWEAEDEKYMLLSKIMVFNELREDW
ncbi:abortive infection system antitoxin AbiGi family protein [Metabacillus fastidiosus]|uniref:abortive infection system antitoxin AbiGi family protein n=1 Tax=Metabacillus fastidiosus TaxID=1458 RepID=UPI002DB8115A|nr:abortive infection system antitoxin AbiGi family protein [Metabacillus fastidiosus]MEC2078634.1 abortive infection system antitoxin AbiGi family protein [Metabacillus fastidiosus]